MGKKFIYIFISIICLCMFSFNVSAEENYSFTNQSVMYENKVVNITEPIVNIEGNIYVPIRTFCEKIGYNVDWSRNGIVIYKSANDYKIIREGEYKYILNKGYIWLRKLGDILDKEVSYDNRTATALINSSIPKTSKVIVIDAGHGGKDSGAVGNDIVEKNPNLYIAQKVRDTLVSYGYTVFMTRDADVSVELLDRSIFANDKKADLFVSIHNNSAENTSARGTEVLCQFGTESEKLAKNILDSVTANIQTTNRGLKDGSRMSVIRNTNMPAVIVEGLFLSNAEDANMLKDTNILKAIASGICSGIQKTL